jgi:hypothetical protein
MNWLPDLPEEQGDYLWVNIWGCNCCVRSSGICWIREVEPEENPEYSWTAKNGKLLGLFDVSLRLDGTPDIDYFLKLKLPPTKE